MYNENWLVISNCTTHGIANCLQSQTKCANVFGVDTASLSNEIDDWATKIHHYDRIFANSEGIGLLAPFEQVQNRIRHIPYITSSIYHPDFVDLIINERLVRTLCGHYHSMIIYASYCLGIEEKHVESLFCTEMYHKLGYFGSMAEEKRRIINNYSELGLNIKPYIHRWGRYKPFMYTGNHPTIDVLYDVASAILESENVEYDRDDLRPSDSLSFASVPPILTQLADHLGSAGGSYEFRDFGSYKRYSLNDFIRSSYAKYQEVGVSISATRSPYDSIVQDTADKIKEFFDAGTKRSLGSQ